MRRGMRIRILGLAFLAITVPGSNLEAQSSAGRWSLGLHGGADVTDQHTLKLLGAQLAYGITRGTRIQVGVTSVIEEPGTTMFALLGGQWTPVPWVFRPFVGGGIGLGYQEVGPFSNTEFGWLAQGGFRVALRRITPFAELRLIGLNGTTSQILVGFESRAY